MGQFLRLGDAKARACVGAQCQLRGSARDPAASGCMGARAPAALTDHVCPNATEEEDILGQVSQGLPRQAHHHARADL